MVILGSLTIGTASAVAFIAMLNGWVIRLIGLRGVRILERERRDTMISVLKSAPSGSRVIEHRADGTCISLLTSVPDSVWPGGVIVPAHVHERAADVQVQKCG
jgi:hypothetical protein